jgi:hypothetical protein
MRIMNSKSNSFETIFLPGQAAMKVSQAARYLGISPNTLRKRTDIGLIPARRDVNGDRLYLVRELESYLASLPRIVDGSMMGEAGSNQTGR